MALTSTERVRAHRERVRQAPPTPDPVLVAILAALADLALSQAAILAELRSIRGETLSTERFTERSETLRNGAGRRGRGGARVHTRGEPNPPTGVVGTPAPPWNETDYTDHDQRVLEALVAPGSVGAVQDATDLRQDLTVGALVRLQGRGLVERRPGHDLYPDTWARTTDGPVPILEALAAVPLTLDLEAPTFRVDCLDYRAHQSAHHWDPALGAFRCDRCNSQAAEGSSPPTPPSAAPRQASVAVTTH